MSDERTTIEIPTSLLEVVRTIGEGYETALAAATEAEVVQGEVMRGDKADAMMAAVAAALAALEPMRGQMDNDDFARLASIAGYTISDLAWIERAETAIARCDTLDAEAEAERLAAEAQARSEFPLTEAGELDIEQVPEAARSIVRSAWDKEQDIKAREAEVARKEQEQADKDAADKATAEEAEVTRTLGADDLKDLSGDKEKRHAVALRTLRSDEQLYNDMLELWRQEAAAARAPVGELGSSAEPNAAAGGRTEALAICEARAKALMEADPTLTRSQADNQVWKNDPKLYDQYRHDGPQH